MAFNIRLAVLLGIWLETGFWGLYSGLFMVSLVVLFSNRCTQPTSNFVLATTVSLYLLSTVHVATTLYRLIHGFIALEGQASADYLMDFSRPVTVFRQFIYVTNGALSDGVLVWRCLVVWRCDWRICTIPSLLLVATTVIGYYTASLYATLPQGNHLFASRVDHYATILFALSLVTNAITTSLIATRVWWLSKRIDQPVLVNSPRYRAILAIVIESGVLYSLFRLCELVLYAIHHNAIFMLVDVMAQLMGIIPTVIIVYVGLGGTRVLPKDPMPPARPFSREESRSIKKAASIGRATTQQRFSSNPIAVTVTRDIAVVGDEELGRARHHDDDSYRSHSWTSVGGGSSGSIGHTTDSELREAAEKHEPQSFMIL